MFKIKFNKSIIKVITIALVCVIISRLFITLLVCYRYPDKSIDINNFFVIFFHGLDSSIYYDIATKGYSYIRTGGFFPLFPIVARISTIFSFGGNLNTYVTSIFANTIFLLVTCVFSYKHIMLTRNNEKMAILSMVLLTFGPWSYISYQMMSESLFMMLLIMAMYSLKKEYYIRMGICGALLSAARSIGVFFAIVVLVEMIQKYFNENKFRSFKGFFKYCISKPRLMIGVCLIPIGVISFLIFCQVQFNDALIYIHVQRDLYSHVYVGYFLTLFSLFNKIELPFVLFAALITISLIVHKRYSESVLPIIAYLLVGFSYLEGLPRYYFSCFTIMYGFLDLFKYDNKLSHKFGLYSSVGIAILFEFVLVYYFTKGFYV